ncbi:MAG: cytochrome c [Syntrophobacteraceae bacterium]
MKRIFISCFVILSVMAIHGCGSSRRGEPLVGRTLETGSQQIAAGERVFMKYCHQCHPGGEGGLGPALNDKPAPGFLVKFQVRHGLGAMPGFPPERISDSELDSIVAYMLALRHHRGPDR